MSPAPLEVEWLGTWISRVHLDASAVAVARARFEGGLPHALVLDGFLEPALAATVSAFLSAGAPFETGYGVHAQYGFVSAEAFQATAPDDRFFRYQTMRPISPTLARTQAASGFARAERRLADPYTRDLFAAWTGMALGGMTLSARQMRRGDFLAPHTDDIDERCLSYVIYLSPGWDLGDGGALMLARGDGTFQRVVPSYNRLVVFDARIRHHVEAITTERARLTLGGWYLKP